MKYLGCFFAIASAAWCAEIGLVEEIVAKVNGDIVTLGDLDRARKDVVGRLQHDGLQGGALEKAYTEQSKNVLRDKIDNLLLVQKAKDLNISVDTEVSKYLAGIQSEAKVADPDKFHDLVQQQTGMPFEDFKADVRNNMLTQRVIRQDVGGKMNVGHQEIEKYYNEHKADFMRDERVFLREMLVSTEGKDAAGIAAAEKKAKDLAARAKKGERFAELARDNSDATTAKAMGDLGGWKKGDLNPVIEGVVWDKPKGFVTDPIRVESGFLVLRIEDHQKAGQAELSDVENDIQEKLFMPRLEPAVRQYLTKLRQTAFLEIKPGYIDTGAAAGKSTAWVDAAQLKPETVTKAEVKNAPRHKKLLWAVPIPGTQAKDAKGSSSSK